MFPVVPASFAGILQDQLATWRAEITAAAKAALSTDGAKDADLIASVRLAMSDRGRIDAELAVRATADAALAADAAALAAELGLADTDPAAADEAAAAELAVTEAATAAAAELAANEPGYKPSFNSRFGTPSAGTPALPVPSKEVRLAPQYLQKVGSANETFSNWTEVAQAMIDQTARISGGTSERYTVAQINGNYPAERQLSDDMLLNLSSFDQDEIMAAMCAPCEPYYGLSCNNVTRRPVFNSLPQWMAARGCTTIYPSPSLSDITTGFGIWTNVEDSNPLARKALCQTIACATPAEYRIYAVYMCLRVTNLLSITFPELVAAYLNRLTARHARLAEIQLLNQMAAGATPITVTPLGYNATTSLMTSIITYLGLLQEQERWDITGSYEAWLPRWVLLALKTDQMRRRNTSGGVVAVPSDAEIIGQFRDAGVNVTFFIDTPAWAAPIPAVQTAGVLNIFPGTVDILIAPPGKFGVMDRGNIQMGVVGGNVVRDSVLNSVNSTEIWVEVVEGIVNTNTCPAGLLQMDLCFNGIQIDDRVINCVGV